MKKLFLFLLIIFSVQSFGQQLTGTQLLEKAIQYHDANGNWKTFTGNLFVTMEMPNKPSRESEISINLPQEYFYVKATRGDITTELIVEKTACKVSFNGDKNPSEAIKKKYRLNCKRAKMYQNYYTYLYGLPMKLQDKGTVIHEKVTREKFKGKEYLVLKVTYKKEVGKDTWYFYFNPKTYKMEVYQFFHDETKNDGEYILLTEEALVNGIKMPKNRAWYTNKEDKLLGTDILKR